MKFIIAICLFMCSSNFLLAQDSTSLKWQTTITKITDKQYKVTFSTNVPSDLSLYAPGTDLGGLQSASITFNDSSISVAKITTGSTVKKVASNIFENVTVGYQQGAVTWDAVLDFKKEIPSQLIGSLSYFFNKGDEFISATPSEFSLKIAEGVSNQWNLKRESINIANPLSDCGDDLIKKGASLWQMFLAGFLGGLIALLTPCVFPMIPVTVTFFTKKSTNRKKAIFNASIYGLFIFLIYVVITVPFHVLSSASPEIFNNISTNVWVNLVFFVVFVAFALSFFGLYEIVLPSNIANAADSKSGLGNIAGIFFMATTLAIVSFSCTGPILGSLLASASGADANAWPLTAAAAGFGIALGLPFALFAMFPNWLQSLPKSGGWMTDVKVVLGFVELALAIKFLANADNVLQWGIVKREVFVASWVIISVLIALYLLGFLRIGHSTKPKSIGIGRWVLIVAFVAFAVYLAPGVTNSKYAALKTISGFPPPLSYTVYKDHVLLQDGVKPIHNDYEKALQLSKETGKPILIDFTGWACVNCRRMEETVWIDPVVKKLMKEKFIVVSLYVDEKIKLPAAEQQQYTTKDGSAKNIITVGDKWATFQLENFNATAQPQYAIINKDEKAVTKTKFYTVSPSEFAKWLQCGLDNANK